MNFKVVSSCSGINYNDQNTFYLNALLWVLCLDLDGNHALINAALSNQYKVKRHDDLNVQPRHRPSRRRRMAPGPSSRPLPRPTRSTRTRSRVFHFILITLARVYQSVVTVKVKVKHQLKNI